MRVNCIFGKISLCLRSPLPAQSNAPVYIRYLRTTKLPFQAVYSIWGVQLFTLGIIGEYLGHMHFRAMGRPPYIIQENTGKDISE